MPKTKTTPPVPDRQKGQRSLDLPIYLQRILPQWAQPYWYNANQWRYIVANQPIAVICRDTLIENIVADEWKIEARDSEKRDEYKPKIDYYTKFLKDTGGCDYVELIEWIMKDCLDIPFGGAVELGYKGDDPRQDLVWIEPLDGGTLFPTLNSKWPVGQSLHSDPMNSVFFPPHAINRIYMSPRTEIDRKGWGMPPAEKIYLALELLSRGDRYYANLLLDTPEVGLLDLIDMEQESAEEWVKSWKELLIGIDPFKIPVLYEHTQPAKYIPFNRSPTELMFDKATMKYAAIVAAGYGMSLSDIGFQAVSSGGETLAGSIRQERKTRRTGLAITKNKLKLFFDRMLPDYLEFKWIELDDELSVARGRAKLASATASQIWVSNRIFTPNEMRQQTIADGLINISVPENIDGGDEFPENGNRPDERPGLLGKPIAPSQGGYGEVKSDMLTDSLGRIFSVDDSHIRRMVSGVVLPVYSEVSPILSQIFELDGLEPNDLDDFLSWHNDIIWGNIQQEIPELTLQVLSVSRSNLSNLMPDHFKSLLPDEDKALDELTEIFKEIEREYRRQQMKVDYELGRVDEYDSEYDPEKYQTNKFKRRIRPLLQQYFSEILEGIKNGTIIGVRNYLLDAGFANKLEESLDVSKIIRDNSVVNFVRDGIRTTCLRAFYKLTDEISQKIEGILEEQTNG